MNTCSVGVTSIIRVVTTYKAGILNDTQWAAAQVNVGIVCACLPTLGPVPSIVGDMCMRLRKALSLILGRCLAGKFRSTKTLIEEPAISSRRIHNCSSIETLSAGSYPMKTVRETTPTEISKESPFDDCKRCSEAEAV